MTIYCLKNSKSQQCKISSQGGRSYGQKYLYIFCGSSNWSIRSSMLLPTMSEWTLEENSISVDKKIWFCMFLQLTSTILSLGWVRSCIWICSGGNSSVKLKDSFSLLFSLTIEIVQKIVSFNKICLHAISRIIHPAHLLC